MINSRLLARGLLLIAVTLLLSACGDDDEQRPCVLCPGDDAAITATLNYIGSHRAELGLRDQIDRLIPYRVSRDELGMTHVRCYQFYILVRVESGELIVHLNSDLQVASVTNAVIPGVSVDINPDISEREARHIARADFEADGLRVTLQKHGELLVFIWNEVQHLCWATEVDGDLIHAREYFIDAHSGEIVHWRDLVIA
jgi:Zn-dependent metalloprotease